MLIPVAYLDPLTLELMLDPMFTRDGNTYEKASIEEWFRRGHAKSPVTGQFLAADSSLMTPHADLLQQIITFINQHSTYFFWNSGTTELNSSYTGAMWLELSLDLKEEILRISDTNRYAARERKPYEVPSLFQDIRSISNNKLLDSTSPLVHAVGNPRYPHAIDACLAAVKALYSIRKNPGLVHALIEAMGRLANHSDEAQSNCHRLGALGACELIACVFRDWSHHVEITKAALDLVYTLSKDSVKNRTRLGVAGVCEDVVTALSSFSSDAEVQFYGWWAVSALGLAPENRTSLVQLGACNSLVSAMRSFPSDGRVQVAGCLAISILAAEVEVAKKLGLAGGPEAVVATLKTFLQPLENLVYRALEASLYLLVGIAGGPDFLVAELKALQQAQEVFIGSALMAISCLAAEGTNRRRFKIMEVHEDVIAAIKGFPESPPVQELGRGALHLLCSSGTANSVIHKKNSWWLG